MGRSPIRKALSAYAIAHAILSTLILGVVGIALIAIGSHFRRRPVADAVVTAVRDKSAETCIDLRYTFRGKTRTAELCMDTVPAGGYSVGDRVRVFVDPDVPGSISLDTAPHNLGWYLIAGGAFLLILVAVQDYVLWRFKSARPVLGGIDLVGALS